MLLDNSKMGLSIAASVSVYSHTKSVEIFWAFALPFRHRHVQVRQDFDARRADILPRANSHWKCLSSRQTSQGDKMLVSFLGASETSDSCVEMDIYRTVSHPVNDETAVKRRERKSSRRERTLFQRFQRFLRLAGGLCWMYCCPPYPDELIRKHAFIPPYPTYIIKTESGEIIKKATRKNRDLFPLRIELRLKHQLRFNYTPQKELEKAECFLAKTSRRHWIPCVYYRCPVPAGNRSFGSFTSPVAFVLTKV